MTITLNITADTASDFFEQLAGLNSGFTGIGTMAFQPGVQEGPIMPELVKEPTRRVRSTTAKEAVAVEVTAIAQPKVAVEVPAEQEVGKPSAANAAETTETTAAATPAITTATTTTSIAPAAANTAILDFDKDVAPIVMGYVKTKTKAWVIAVLNEFGVERASELPSTQWPELINALNDKAGE